MIVLCLSGSTVVRQWKDIRHLAQKISYSHSRFYDQVQNKDMLLLWSLLEGTKLDLSFTCFGILTLDWSLLLKTIVTAVTFGVLML